MKETRAAIALLLFIISLHVAHLLPQNNSTSEITQSYIATACPGSISGARSTALLPDKRELLREISRPQAELRQNRQGSYPVERGALLVEGSPVNTLEIQSRSGKWTAATNCTLSNKTSWFVGGTANVTSQSKLILINSGLSDAIVDITSFSENGPTATVPVTVKPSSEKVIRVDSLDPGANKIILKVETRSGRVISYLLDERVRGLNNLGADFVFPISKPEEVLNIAAIPIKYGSVKNVKHTLRIMTTGKVDATASVEIISPEGVFIPVGFGNISLRSQVAKELDLSDIDLGGKTFGVKVTGTQPIVAGVFASTKVGSISDFMWSAPSPSFGTVAMNLYGLEPTISFIGEKILVNVNWRTNRGKELSKTLIGDEVLNWKVPNGVRLITISNQSGVKAAMNWLSRDGVTHLPLAPSTDIESATKPIADIAVIQPGN